MAKHMLKNGRGKMQQIILLKQVWIILNGSADFFELTRGIAAR
jgi:hypothetical protein